MAAIPTEVQALRTLIERAGGGDAQAARRLEELRTDVLALLADIDQRLNATQSAREAGAVVRRLDIAQARRRAGLREQLVAEGRFTPEVLDGLGVFSAEQLDAMEADGSIEEALEQAAPIDGWAA